MSKSGITPHRQGRLCSLAEIRPPVPVHKRVAAPVRKRERCTHSLDQPKSSDKSKPLQGETHDVPFPLDLANDRRHRTGRKLVSACDSIERTGYEAVAAARPTAIAGNIRCLAFTVHTSGNRSFGLRMPWGASLLPSALIYLFRPFFRKRRGIGGLLCEAQGTQPFGFLVSKVCFLLDNAAGSGVRIRCLLFRTDLRRLEKILLCRRHRVALGCSCP
ncbi:UNVERIFIED_ORG: hypothetical protein LHK14_16215 [Roseateles sp. XES5]|nr:hypothetical protein [Roseateles sp. XES5]